MCGSRSIRTSAQGVSGELGTSHSSFVSGVIKRSMSRWSEFGQQTASKSERPHSSLGYRTPNEFAAQLNSSVING
jgi:transposase InsO family protein